VETNVHYRVQKSNLIVLILSYTKPFNIFPLGFDDPFWYYQLAYLYFLQVNVFLKVNPTKSYRYETRKNYISLNTVIRYSTDGVRDS
jgi:hypothetical protein